MRTRIIIVLLIAVALSMQGCTALLGGGKKRPSSALSSSVELNEDQRHGN